MNIEKTVIFCVLVMMLLSTLGVINSQTSNIDNTVIKTFENDKEKISTSTIVNSAEGQKFFITEGYSVDNPDVIGEISTYTKKLAENYELGMELTEKRTVTARHFLNEDDSITAMISLAPNSYKDSQGLWNDITPQTSLIDWEDYEQISNYYGKIAFYDDHYSIPIVDPSDTRYACWTYKPSQESAKYDLQIGHDGHHDLNPLFWDDMEEFWRAFAQWDTSSVPDGSYIWDWIDVNIFATNNEYEPFHGEDSPGAYRYADLNFYHLSTKPQDFYKSSGGSADMTAYEGEGGWSELQNFMSDCCNGNHYTEERVNIGDGNVEIHLSWEADQDIKNQLKDDWFAVGIDDANEQWGSSDECGGVLLRGPVSGSSEMVLTFSYAVPKNYAVIVAGGYGPDDQAHNSIIKSAERAVQVFESFDDYHVDYMELPNSPTKIKNKIQDTIPNYLGGEKKVFLYFVDHGGADGCFVVNKYGDLMYHYQLDSWISTMESKCNPNSVVVVLEACYSGTYIEKLSHQNKNRVIITSTDHDSSAFYYVDGEAFFSEPFFKALSEGKSYGEAWERADKVVDGRKAKVINYGKLLKITSEIIEKKSIDADDKVESDPVLPPVDRPPRQNPKIDDNGDGVGSGTFRADDLSRLSDGDIALNTYP